MRIGFDSDLLRDVYLSPAMMEIFSAQAQLQSWLDFESALARAEARLGVIPEETAEEITRKARAENIDLASYRAGMKESLHPIVPMVRLLTAACEQDHGQYVHWGATTQDVMDTGMVLQLRSASELLSGAVDRVRTAAVALARRHRSTVMPGRTHGQHAVPITFGYKAAVWVDELDRHIREFASVAEEMEVVQFGGAAGTLASVGRVGLDIRREVAVELSLSEPRITWHVSRDRLLDYGFRLTSIALLLQQIVREIMILQRTEIAEVEEPFQEGKVGSSTMPHKRNPAMCNNVWNLTVVAQDAFRTLMTASPQEHERDGATWQLEWDALPRLCVYVHRALDLTGDILSGLRVNPERMRANIDLTQGLIMSEATMMRLAPVVGRQHAHDIVYDAAMQVFEQGADMRTLLAADDRLAQLDDPADLADPESVIDAAELLVDRVCADEDVTA